MNSLTLKSLNSELSLLPATCASNYLLTIETVSALLAWKTTAWAQLRKSLYTCVCETASK